jgi:hypothetical protein
MLAAAQNDDRKSERPPRRQAESCWRGRPLVHGFVVGVFGKKGGDMQLSGRLSSARQSIALISSHWQREVEQVILLAGKAVLWNLWWAETTLCPMGRSVPLCGS